MSMAEVLNYPARPDYLEQLQHADTEIDNLRAAFSWSLETADTETALRLASSLFPVWQDRGRNGEGLAWLEAALGPETASPPVDSRVACTRDCRQGHSGCVDCYGQRALMSPRQPLRSRARPATRSLDPGADRPRHQHLLRRSAGAARALSKRPNSRRGWMTHGSGVRSMSRRRAPRSGQAIPTPPSKRPRRHSKWLRKSGTTLR